MTTSPTTPPLRLSWTVWGLGALLYLIGFYQRVAPAVMTNELMRDFNLSATALGNLSAFYFYSYVAMQIPTGILSDSLGPRKLITCGTVAAAGGTLLFGFAPGYSWACIGRMLIGGSVAVAWVCMLKLAAHWFPARFFAGITGVALFFGISGAVFAGVPLRVLIDMFGWRPLMGVSAVLTGVLACFVWKIIRDDPSDKGFRSHAAPRPPGEAQKAGRPVIKDFSYIFRNRNTWLLLIIPSGIVGSALTFSGLWGVPYLIARYHITETRAAGLTSTILVAWAVGGPVFGWMSDRMKRRKPLYIIGAWTLTLGWAMIFYVPSIPLSALVLLLLVTGFASGCIVISFAMAKESVPIHLAGTVSGVINGAVMTGPVVLQPLVGWILDRQWTGAIAEGVRVYSPDAYHAAFGPMVCWAALASLLLFLTHETYCRQKGQDPPPTAKGGG